MYGTIVVSSIVILMVLLVRLLFGRILGRRFLYALWLIPAFCLLFLPFLFGDTEFEFCVWLSQKAYRVARAALANGFRVFGITLPFAKVPSAKEYFWLRKMGYGLDLNCAVLNLKFAGVRRIWFGGMVLVLLYHGGAAIRCYLHLVRTARRLPDYPGEGAGGAFQGGILHRKLQDGSSNQKLQDGSLNQKLQDGGLSQDFRAWTGLKVFETREVWAPVLMGTSIFLPWGIREHEAEYRYSLLHEEMHFRQGDFLWNWLRILLVSVYWFCPLVWLAVYVSKKDAEFSCDENVLKTLSFEERQEYGRVILEFATGAVFEKREGLLKASLVGADTKKRIKQMFRPQKKKWCRYFLTAAVFGVFLAGAAAFFYMEKSWEGQIITDNSQVGVTAVRYPEP